MKNFDLSRKIHLFGIFTLLWLFAGFSLSAQQIITEHSSGTSDESITYPRNLDQNSYTKVLVENGNKVFLKNQPLTQNRPQNENATNDVSLNINFVFDDSQFYASSVMIYDETGYMQTWTYQNFTNPLVVDVPVGTYDIITEFQPLNDSGKSHILIKEQENIQGNSNIQINIANAINYVSTTAYDENGEILEPNAGFVGHIFFDRTLYFNPTDLITINDNYFLIDPFGGQDPDWNFYINDVSDRYSIIQTLVGIGYDQGDYFTKFETIAGIEDAVSLANNPTDWSHHSEIFQTSQVGDDDVSKAFFFASTYNGLLISGWGHGTGPINPGEEPFNAFINNSLNGDPADFLVIPAMVDHFVYYGPTQGGESYFIKGNPVFSDGNGGVLYGSGDVSFNTHSSPFLADDYYLMDTNKVKLLPFHPRFSFDNATTPSIILGNNVPITVSGFTLNPTTLKLANKGRYGENRETDYFAMDIEVKQNGSVIFSGSYEDFGSFNLPSNGPIEIVVTNANTLVEGLQGINTTTINYNASENDAPPTLQHLQFRDSDDQATCILDSNVGATVRLAAGDFTYTNIDGSSGYYTYEPGNNVALSYSIYNQNDWSELEITEYPEYFQIPAFGDYYEASLEAIRSIDHNVWYDLKVICTDAAGNTQEQVISPAFKIKQSLGIEDIVESNFVVYPNPFSDQLNIVLSENLSGNYTFKVSDMIGRTVYTDNQNEKSFSWNTSVLSKGVYILSIENNGKAVVKKVIKK